jgi:hypothetical protein
MENVRSSTKSQIGYDRGMTAQLSFNTLALAKRLAAAGMDPRQAEALAEALHDIVFDTLATKNDLRELELRLTHSLTVRMGAMIAAATAILGALNILH